MGPLGEPGSHPLQPLRASQSSPSTQTMSACLLPPEDVLTEQALMESLKSLCGPKNAGGMASEVQPKAYSCARLSSSFP